MTDRGERGSRDPDETEGAGGTAADVSKAELEEAMEEEAQGGARTFVAGLVIGVLVGAGLALLFAPQSGEEARRHIRRRARRLAADVEERYGDVKQRLRRVRRRRERDEEATAE